MTRLVWMVLLGLGLAMAGSAATVVADTVVANEFRFRADPWGAPEHHCVGEPPIGWLICILL